MNPTTNAERRSAGAAGTGNRRSIRDDGHADRPSDWQLVRAASEGSDGAFRELVERHTPAVMTEARRRVHRQALAEDIAQEAFIRLFRSLDSIRPRTDVGPWLRRVTANLAVDTLRRRKRYAEHVALDEVPSTDQPRGAGAADARLHLAETRRAVWRALDELSPELRDVVVLRYLADWSYREISRALELAPGTVGSRLHRALKELGEIVGTHGTHGPGRPSGAPPTTESGDEP